MEVFSPICNVQDESSDDDDDDEYDDVLVTLSFPDFDKTNFLKNEKSLTFEGLTSNRSTGISKCTIGGYVFEGQHEHTLGTQLFFMGNENIDAKEMGNKVSSTLSFVGMTSLQSRFELREIVQTKQEYKERMKLLADKKTKEDTSNNDRENSIGNDSNKHSNHGNDCVNGSNMNMDDSCKVGTSTGSPETGS